MRPDAPAPGQMLASCPQEDRQDQRTEGEAYEDELGGVRNPGGPG
jgi:hypothetical protein